MAQAYPEHEDFQVDLALGDPQCSPVWTAGTSATERLGLRFS
jgi:hypothetical protein